MLGDCQLVYQCVPVLESQTVYFLGKNRLVKLCVVTCATFATIFQVARPHVVTANMPQDCRYAEVSICYVNKCHMTP